MVLLGKGNFSDWQDLVQWGELLISKTPAVKPVAHSSAAEWFGWVQYLAKEFSEVFASLSRWANQLEPGSGAPAPAWQSPRPLPVLPTPPPPPPIASPGSPEEHDLLLRATEAVQRGHRAVAEASSLANSSLPFDDRHRISSLAGQASTELSRVERILAQVDPGSEPAKTLRGSMNMLRTSIRQVEARLRSINGH